MGRTCAVFGCKNKSAHTKARGEIIIYHRFPNTNNFASSTLRKEWVRRCRRANKFNADTSQVCSIHFSNDDYERDLQNELLGLPLKRVLKKTAVPTLNLPLCKNQSESVGQENLLDVKREEVVYTCGMEKDKGKGGYVCTARLCENNHIRSGFSFFRFPKNPTRSRLWLIASGREDLLSKGSDELYKSYRLCGEHFETKMFLNDLQNRLQPSAVPTIFPEQENISIPTHLLEHNYSRIHAIRAAVRPESAEEVMTSSKYIVPEISTLDDPLSQGIKRENDDVLESYPIKIPRQDVAFGNECTLVKNCKNKTFGRHRANVRIKFYSFPRDEELAAQWVKACGKPNMKTLHSRVCSVHFEESCYRHDWRDEISSAPVNSRSIKGDAIPTINTAHPEQDATPTTDITQFLTDINALDNCATEIVKSETLQYPVEREPDSPHTLSLGDDLRIASPLDDSHSEDEVMVVENNEMSILQEEVESLRRENEDLRQQLVKAETSRQEIMNALNRCFTPGQVQLLLNQSLNHIKWTTADIAAAVELRNVSQDAYKYLLSRKYPLPTLPTLRKWLSNISFEEAGKQYYKVHEED